MSIGPSEAKARKPYAKTDSRTEFTGSINPKINTKFLIPTTSGDDVITADKTSGSSIAVMVGDIQKREWDSLNSFLRAF